MACLGCIAVEAFGGRMIKCSTKGCLNNPDNPDYGKRRIMVDPCLVDLKAAARAATLAFLAELQDARLKALCQKVNLEEQFFLYALHSITRRENPLFQKTIKIQTERRGKEQ
jgi:hypothetical protein